MTRKERRAKKTNSVNIRTRSNAPINAIGKMYGTCNKTIILIIKAERDDGKVHF